MAKKINITAKARKQANRVIGSILKPTYFKGGVPLNEIAVALKEQGIVMIMEDNTEWAGFLLGAEGRCFIRLAPVSSCWTPDNPEGYIGHGLDFYEPFENTGLVLTWYKMESRLDKAIEVVGYIS